jgi:hypothetical protein
MASIDLVTAWTLLTKGEQLVQWRGFITALDAGGAGYHRFYPVLMPLWDRGDVPAEIETEGFEVREAEMRAEASWAARHGADAWCMAEGALADPEPWLGLEKLLGAPPF